MKGLAAVVGLVVLMQVSAIAGGVGLFAGAGPGGAALGEINQAITLYNRLLDNFNHTPTITGNVPPIPQMGSGITYQAGEQFWITTDLALGGKIEYFRTSVATTGEYQSGGEKTPISIALDCSTIGFVLTGGFNFLHYGFTLGVHGGVGYYYSGFTSNITFSVPSGYNKTISVHPHTGTGHYNNRSLGLEAGLSMVYPVTTWLALGVDTCYRALTAPRLVDAHGTGLDLDGDGTAERIDLSGISVQISVSIKLDLFR